MVLFHRSGIAGRLRDDTPRTKDGVLGWAGRRGSLCQAGRRPWFYYEIDPDNEGIARALVHVPERDAGGCAGVVGDGGGDGQKSTGRRPPYTSLHMDACTGDASRPTWLKRKQSDLAERLKDDGVILFQVRTDTTSCALSTGPCHRTRLPAPSRADCRDRAEGKPEARRVVRRPCRDPGRLDGLIKKGLAPPGPGRRPQGRDALERTTISTSCCRCAGRHPGALGWLPLLELDEINLARERLPCQKCLSA